MRICTFYPGSEERLGIVTSSGIIDAQHAYRTLKPEPHPEFFSGVTKFLEGGKAALTEALSLVRYVEEMSSSEKKAGQSNREKLLFKEAEVSLGPPIPRPGKIFCPAVNYRSHAGELRAEPPPEPYFFCKFANAVTGPYDPIPIPKVSKKVDYEVELAVVIGKRGKYIPRDEAYDYIAGYMVVNDVTYRDLQKPPTWPEKLGRYGQNWVKGKALDKSLPCGPHLVLKDELTSLYPLRLALRVNGEIRQEGSTEEMVFRIPELIEYISEGITLDVGDIVSTGTPQGVAFATDHYLKAGDIVETEVEKVGVLRNPVVAESRI